MTLRTVRVQLVRKRHHTLVAVPIGSHILHMTALDNRLVTGFQDRYRLEREIGAGGMATVYLAHDLRHDRKVAIKVLHAELAAAIGAERFLAEIKVTANLQHPDSVLLIADQRARPRAADFSPDGRWLAYVARFVNRDEVYVHSLDSRGNRWRPGTEQPVGAVRVLFRLGPLAGGYDVLPGDSTFVMLAPNDAERRHVVVIANFVEQLRARPTSRTR